MFFWTSFSSTKLLSSLPISVWSAIQQTHLTKTHDPYHSYLNSWFQGWFWAWNPPLSLFTIPSARSKLDLPTLCQSPDLLLLQKQCKCSKNGLFCACRSSQKNLFGKFVWMLNDYLGLTVWFQFFLFINFLTLVRAPGYW